MFELCDLEDLVVAFGVNPSPEDIKRTVALLLRGRGDRHELPAPEDAAFEAVFNRASECVRLGERLPVPERLRFHEALSSLISGGGAQSLTRGCARLGVYEALLARSWVLRFDDLEEMCRLAHAAAEMAGRFSPRVYGAQRVADLRARAWGELANAFRVADRLGEAKLAFGKAFSFRQRGTDDPLLRARLLDLEASYYGTLREFASAQDRLDIVPELYRRAGEPHLAGRTLITRAVYLGYGGNHEEALRLTREGLLLIDPERDPVLLRDALHNQLGLLVDLGRLQEAGKLLFKNRGRLQSCGGISKLKLQGIEGQINYGSGNLVSAEGFFRKVKRGFAKAGMKFHSAVAGLHLATALLRQGQIDEAEKEVLEAAKVFFSLRIRREIFGSVLLLKEAAEMRRLTVALVENEVRHIRRVEREHGPVEAGG
jgi:tetratricopeptide (TPR) repeat protein